MENTIECYRFVGEDLTSVNGELSWTIGEWSKVSGPIVCCSNGLHAAPTPRDSFRNVYGQRWFIAEARGEIDRQREKFAAAEMRLVREIPGVVLRRFAVWCAEDSLQHLGTRDPNDDRISQCVQATDKYLNGELSVEELRSFRQAAAGALADGSATGRPVAAAIAASCAADGDAAAWTAAAVAAAYAAHAAAEAVVAADALVSAHAAVSAVASGIAAAVAADHAALAAHTAASAGAVAHAAAVAAARGVPAADTASDPYFAAFNGFAVHPHDAYYESQNTKLLEFIDRFGSETV